MSHSQQTSVIPGVINLSLNSSTKILPYFALGEIVNDDVFLPNGEEFFHVELIVTPNPKAHLRGPSQQFSSFYQINSTQAYYERKYAGITCALLVDGMNSDKMKVYANAAYLRLVKFRLDSLYPVGTHITDLLMLRILGRNDLIIHGASLENPHTKKGFLLIAPPDTGKTYTTFKLLEQQYHFLGEDLSYYRASTDEIVCMPYTSTWGHRFKFSKFSLSSMPFVGFFFSGDKKGVKDLFGKESVTESARLGDIYLLQKSTRQAITKIEPSPQLLRQIMAIQRNEFSYFKNPLIRAYEYYNPVDVDGVFTKEHDNMLELLNKKTLYLIEAPSYRDFYGMINKHQMAT